MTTTINGNLDVKGTVSSYVDTSLTSLPENHVNFWKFNRDCKVSGRGAWCRQQNLLHASSKHLCSGY